MDSGARALRAWWIAGLVASACALASGIAARSSSASLADDALALLRYETNLRSSGAFAWDVEQPAAIGIVSPLHFTAYQAARVLLHDGSLALAAVSLLSTAVGAAACFALGRGAARSARDPRLAFDWLVALVLGLAAVPLAYLATSGLEAAFAFALTGVFAWLWSQGERVDARRGGWVLGTFGAALFAARAELAIYGMGVPLVVALSSRDAQRRQAQIALAVSAAGTALCGAWLALANGAPVPLAFVLAHPSQAPLDAWRELARFLAIGAPLWIPIVVELGLRRGAPRGTPRILERAFALTTVVFLIDASVGAPRLDASSLRWLLPALPPLVLLGARAAVGIRRWSEWRGRRVPSAPLFLLAVGALLAPLAALWQHVDLARAELAAGRLGRFEGLLAPERVARWPGLAELAPLAPPPHDLRRPRLCVACAPAGEVGAALTLAQVIDLSGAHDARIAARGLDPAELLGERRPDWLWLPPAERAPWAGALRAAPELARDYEVVELGAVDVAWRRASVWRVELARIAGELAPRR